MPLFCMQKYRGLDDLAHQFYIIGRLGIRSVPFIPGETIALIERNVRCLLVLLFTTA